MDPTFVPLKVKLPGVADTVAIPVPLRATVSGVELALLVMLQVPESVPDVEGANAMFAVQLADAASVEVQVVEETEKSVGSESTPVLSVTELAVVLVTLMVWAVLVDPTYVLLNVKLLGAADTTPAPFPVRLTASGVELALEVTLQEPESVPAFEGAKATLAVQLADAASVEPQVVEEIEKSDGSESTPALSVTELAVLLVTVMAWAVLVDPTFVLLNVKLPGVADTTPEPVPLRATVSGVELALLVILQLPESVPEVEGAKATLAVQLADTPRVEPQVVEETEKSVGSDSTPALSVTELAVLLVSVMVWALLVDPTFVMPNGRLPGVADTTPAGAMPRPVREICWGLLASLSSKFRVAVRVPELVGLKTMFAVQLAAAANVVPQVFERTAKSVASVPVNPMLFIVMAPLPEFVSVTVFCPLVLPTATLFHISEVGDAVV